MCLILFAWQPDRKRELVVIANRDEYYSRATSRATYWAEAPELLAGRDLEAGGTWLGITRSGRFAAVTNYRDGRAQQNGAPSRGLLVSDYLRSDLEPVAYLCQLSTRAEAYNGFNLIVGDRATLAYLSNTDGGLQVLGPGVYGLSNHLLDTAWPKVERGKAALKGYLADSGEGARERLMSVLAERDVAPDDTLPDTGVGLRAERALSPLFIATPNYGTRCTTFVEKWRSGDSSFYERSFKRDGSYGEVDFVLGKR